MSTHYRSINEGIFTRTRMNPQNIIIIIFDTLLPEVGRWQDIICFSRYGSQIKGQGQNNLILVVLLVKVIYLACFDVGGSCFAC